MDCQPLQMNFRLLSLWLRKMEGSDPNSSGNFALIVEFSKERDFPGLTAIGIRQPVQLQHCYSLRPIVYFKVEEYFNEVQ